MVQVEICIVYEASFNRLANETMQRTPSDIRPPRPRALKLSQL